PRTVEVRQMHLHFRWAYELATHARVLDAVEDLLGPDLLVWATELFAKHPHDSHVAIGWPRDRPDLGFCPAATTTASLALGDSTAANGCMRAVPGPGRTESRRDKESAGQGNLSACPANSLPGSLDVVLRAGEMSLHDADIPHGSGPNLSNQKRVGFAIRFITSEARPLGGRPPVLRARGCGGPHPFPLPHPPP